MNPFFQITIVAYLFFAVPVLLGVLEAAIFQKEEKGISEIITNGYLIMLAMFWIIATIFIWQGRQLSVLTKGWCVVTTVSSLVGLIVGWKKLKSILIECKEFWQGRQYFLLLVTVLSLLVSIGFTRPATEDITALIVDTSVKTDSMYLVNPYSGYETGMVEESYATSPLEMLYAIGVQITGADTQMIIYYVLPVILLIFFFLTIWRVSGSLVEQEEQRVWFEVVAIILYWMTAFDKERALVTGIFLNCWNGLTILSCIILPLAFSLMVKWMQQAEHGIKNIPAKFEKSVLTIMLILAAQLINNKGGFYILLMLFLTIAVIIVKGGYTYVIKTGRFKKRI